jgi:hypothetical protein
MRTINLTKTDVVYLTNSRFLPEDLAQIVCSAQPVDDGERVLTLDQDIAERFRDEFTARLAKAGFGTDYEPTREGKLLEDLIDRFAAEKS